MVDARKWTRLAILAGMTAMLAVLLGYGASFTACGHAEGSMLGSFCLRSASLAPAHSPPSRQYQRRSRDRASGLRTPLEQCQASLHDASPADALKTCDQAVKFDPSHAGPYKLRGQAHLLLNHVARARDDFEHSLALDPADPETHADRGQVFARMKDFWRARDDFDQAIRLAPAEARWWNERCWMRVGFGRELAMAVSDCSEAARRDSELAEAFAGRGFAHLKLSLPLAAIGDFDAAIDARNDYALAFFGRGVSKITLRRAHSGQRDLERARRIDPQVDKSFLSLGFKIQRPVRRRNKRGPEAARSQTLF